VPRAAEVSRVVQRLEAAGCAPVVLKGTALAYSHYEVPWLRPRLDTDVLIAAESRTRAAGVFAELGYVRPPLVDGSLVMYQEMYVRAGAGGLEHVFDVHWRVSNAQVVSQVLTHAVVRARAAVVTTPSGPWCVACAVHGLVLACVHRAAHHHDSPHLLWLHDIHLLAQRLTEDDWHLFFDIAVAQRVTTLCARGLELARACFSTPVPSWVMPAWSRARRAPEPSEVFLRPGVTKLRQLWSDLGALTPRDRARLLREIAWPSRRYMRCAYGDEGWLVWLYVRRILRGAATWVVPIQSAAALGGSAGEDSAFTTSTPGRRPGRQTLGLSRRSHPHAGRSEADPR
jgi:hypothetical protein